MASNPTPSPDTCDPTSPTNSCPPSQCVYYTPAPSAEKGCCNNCCSTSSCVTNFGGTNYNNHPCESSSCCSCTYPSTCSSSSSKMMGYITVSSASNCAAYQIYANMVCVEDGNSANYKVCENILYPGKTYYPTFAPTGPTYEPTTIAPTYEPTRIPTYTPTIIPSEIPTSIPSEPDNSTQSASDTGPVIDHVAASKEFSAAYIFVGVVFIGAFVFYYIDSKFNDVWVFQCDLTNPSNDLVSFINFKDDSGNILLSIKPNISSFSINLSHEIRKTASPLSWVRLSESSISRAVGNAGDIMPHNCNLQLTVRLKWGLFVITSSAIENNVYVYKNHTTCRNRVTRIESSVNWTSANIKPGKTNAILMYVYPSHDELLMTSHKSVTGAWSTEVKSLAIDFPIPENGTVEIVRSEFYYSVALRTSNVHKVECDYFIPLSLVNDRASSNKYNTLKTDDIVEKEHAHDSRHSKMFDSISISKTSYDNDNFLACCIRNEYHYNLFCGTNESAVNGSNFYNNVKSANRSVFELEPFVPTATATILSSKSAALNSVSAADVEVRMVGPYATSSPSAPAWVRQLDAAEKEFHADEP